ncbi:kinetochore complex Fta4 of Sim4 subunit, or CENP-50-domain-containing protein [Dissophora ornata]|nr:hypothetical protein BGZ58_010060 [Dissophora ornata]KAI8606095.1 kinetochore complex Fta4 of Sim4 subunit, or CENP-50-domain-containing protein [Dissophora ornata]
MAATGPAYVGQARYYHDKKAFISAQVRLLEAPINPPEGWRVYRARLSTKGQPQKPLPDSVISAALSRLHVSSKKTLRLSLNTRSVRQLLEQLEATQYEVRKKAKQGGIIIRTKTVQELLETDWIDAFPETWQHNQDESQSARSGGDLSSSTSSSVMPLTAVPSSSRLQKYADLRSRIVTLQVKYQNLKDRHEYYKTLQGEIRRLDAGEIERSVLSPGSEVVQELAKMKALLLKLITILNSRRDVLTAKRSHQALTAEPDNDAVKRQRHQLSSPLDTVMDLL